jgi:hypothetical protein
VQVGTGEGKSLIIAMVAIYFVKVLGKKVHILENNSALLDKNFEVMKPLYEEFDIKMFQEDHTKSTLSRTTDEKTDCRKEFNNCGVTYCLLPTMKKFYSESILTGETTPLANTVLIADEIHNWFVDDAPNQAFTPNSPFTIKVDSKLKSFYTYYQSIPHILSQYECIASFSEKGGSHYEPSFISEFKAWSFDVPDYLDTCRNISKIHVELMADDKICKGKSCVHVYDTLKQQQDKIIDLCITLHVKVPVLVITKSSTEAIELKAELEAKLEAAGSEVDSIELSLALETANNWYHATNKKNMAGNFLITITDPFGGGCHDYDFQDVAVDLQGGMAVIITSIPASERVWKQWKGRTGRRDNRGQYAVVLNSMDQDSPLASAPYLLKDHRIVNDSQVVIPNVYKESLIMRLFEIREETQKKKLLHLKAEILKGRRLNRLFDAFYTANKPINRTPQQREVLIKLLCDPMIVDPSIDKAFEDLGFKEYDGDFNVSVLDSSKNLWTHSDEKNGHIDSEKNPSPKNYFPHCMTCPTPLSQSAAQKTSLLSRHQKLLNYI